MKSRIIDRELKKHWEPKERSIIDCDITEHVPSIDMFNPWYTNNETYVGPLTPDNELTLDVKQFLRYAQHVKSSSNCRDKKERILDEQFKANYSSKTRNNKNTSNKNTNNKNTNNKLYNIDINNDDINNNPNNSNSDKKNVNNDNNDAVVIDSHQNINNDDRMVPRKNSRYMLNEFIVGPTRMKYYDGSHYLGFASTPYTSPIAIQNIERLVINPDIGYYLRNENTTNDSTSNIIMYDRNCDTTGNIVEKLESNTDNAENCKKNPNDENSTVDIRRKINRYLFEPNDATRDRGEIERQRANELAIRNNNLYVHSDFTRKYSPQEALARVLVSPLFNGNNTKTILQSSKSERYYQLTFPLENCGRMYVLAAPTLPCYSIIQPWAHVCRLFHINQLSPPQRYVVPIESCPQWAYLAEAYNVKNAILLPSNLSMMNRRDPVIQEGSIEIITVVFTYDNCDADIQYNNPYGCYNKHEDYDGDTNTQSVGKGVESYTEICYNMKRQCLPCLRIKSVVPQNMLSRIMLYFTREMKHGFLENDDTRNRLSSVLNNDKALRMFQRNHIVYNELIRRQFVESDKYFDNDHSYANYEITPYAIERVFALELLRRACICITYLIEVDDDELGNRETERQRLLETATRIFKKREYAELYVYYLSKRSRPLLRKLRYFVETLLVENNNNSDANDPEENSKIYHDTRDILHHIHSLWAPVSLNIVTNCQTLIDDVMRTIYCVMGENECTNVLDYCSLTVHRDFPNFFLNYSPFDTEYIVNVLSRAKGDFDSLLQMHTSLYRRFREETNERAMERTRSKFLQLSHRDLLTRIEPNRLEKYIDYTDKYVLGSKKIPKSCKQANSMKWAMQNVQYYDGHLWMNDEVILHDAMRYFSMEFFADLNAVDLVLNDLVSNSDRTD